jgi:hypothetical protein
VAHFYAVPETEPPSIDLRTSEERVREFFAGHNFRIVSLAQFREEWSRLRRRDWRHGDWR